MFSPRGSNGDLSDVDQSLACTLLPWHVSPAHLQVPLYKTPHGVRLNMSSTSFFMMWGDIKLPSDSHYFISQESDPPASAGKDGVVEGHA